MEGVLPEPLRITVIPPRSRGRKVKTTRSETALKTGTEDGRFVTHKRQSWLQSIAHAPSYEPTEKEFEDPLAFIRSIEPEASKFGMCKITVPPNFRSHTDRFPAALKNFTFTAREQKLKEHVWENFGKTEIIYEHAQTFSLKHYRQTVRSNAEKLLKGAAMLPPAFVESEYWRLRSSQDSKDVYVLYGNDVEGSAFDRSDPCNVGSTKWNLQDMGKSPWSLLRHAPMDYPGVTTPMLYIGSLFSTFFWHVEDHWMHSINYSHYGATKTWYGVPSSHADAFEKFVLDKIYRKAIRSKKIELRDAQSLRKCALKQLLAKNTLFSPKHLVSAGVPVFRLDQQPGDFILTFPRGYHSGFSHGFNVGEAVNFALPEWLRAGQASLERYCFLGIPQILPHQLLLVKEAAAVFDRLRRTKQKPNEIEWSTIHQFCSLAEEHAQLRQRLIEEKGLEEVPTTEPLKSQICYMCHRHVCGPFVFYAATGASRCMQCSVRVPHIVHPDWKLAVPEVVGMIQYLEHQFRFHYGVKTQEHPLEWKIPRNSRSHTQHPPLCLCGKRPVAETDTEDVHSVETPSATHADSAVSLLDAVQAKKRRKECILQVVENRFVPMPNGRFRRTLLQDGNKIYILARELLLAIGAPTTRPIDVESVLHNFLLEAQANQEKPVSSISQNSPRLIRRLCNLPSDSVVCTVVDQYQTIQIAKAISDPSIRDRLFRFVGSLWKSLDTTAHAEID